MPHNSCDSGYQQKVKNIVLYKLDYNELLNK